MIRRVLRRCGHTSHNYVLTCLMHYIYHIHHIWCVLSGAYLPASDGHRPFPGCSTRPPAGVRFRFRLPYCSAVQSVGWRSSVSDRVHHHPHHPQALPPAPPQLQPAAFRGFSFRNTPLTTRGTAAHTGAHPRVRWDVVTGRCVRVPVCVSVCGVCDTVCGCGSTRGSLSSAGRYGHTHTHTHTHTRGRALHRINRHPTRGREPAAAAAPNRRRHTHAHAHARARHAAAGVRNAAQHSSARMRG